MVSRSSLWEESDTPPLRPPLPACPQRDLWILTLIPQPAFRSAAEGTNVPRLQPKPGRVTNPIQPGSDVSIYTWEAPGRPMGRIASALPTAPWHTRVQNHINLCPALRTLPREGDRATEAHGGSKRLVGSAGPPRSCRVGGCSGRRNECLDSFLFPAQSPSLCVCPVPTSV